MAYLVGGGTLGIPVGPSGLAGSFGRGAGELPPSSVGRPDLVQPKLTLSGTYTTLWMGQLCGSCPKPF